MDTPEIIKHAKSMQQRLGVFAQDDVPGAIGEAAKAQVCEFLRIYAGPSSSFLKQAEGAHGYPAYVVNSLHALLTSFVQFLEAGLATGVSPERKGQLDVVSDILEQAQTLLEDQAYSPAAAAMLIGAALEEFLRTWNDSEGLSIAGAKPGIDAYAKSLKAAKLVSKQDMKDITSWAGIRNHAAHGEWEEVGDRERVRLMLEGVNLFMRQKQGK